MTVMPAAVQSRARRVSTAERPSSAEDATMASAMTSSVAAP
ncbi:hypothetical protein SAMN05216246_1323, partial [Actinomyces denticolens]